MWVDLVCILVLKFQFLIASLVWIAVLDLKSNFSLVFSSKSAFQFFYSEVGFCLLPSTSAAHKVFLVRRRLRKAARRKRLSDWRVLYFSGHHGWLSKLKFTLLRSSATTTATMTTMARQEPRDLPLTILLYRQDSFARCLKITEKVLFNIASEASYVYI